MRLGKPMEHLQSAAKAALAPGTPVEQITTIGRQLGYFGYLTFDSFVWVSLSDACIARGSDIASRRTPSNS